MLEIIAYQHEDQTLYRLPSELLCQPTSSLRYPPSEVSPEILTDSSSDPTVSTQLPAPSLNEESSPWLFHFRGEVHGTNLRRTLLPDTWVLLVAMALYDLAAMSREEDIPASFYIGTTLVRSLPHAYDLYRAHGSSGYLDLSFIYANHKMDFFSTAWDIIIPCGGLLFAIFVFLQQRFGGQCLLPKRFQKEAVYEKLSVDSSVELQGESVQKNSYSL